MDREQDYAFYGGGGGSQGSRMYKNVQRGSNTGNDYFTEPTTPPFSSRPPSGEFSPGLLDLHSFDTELLPEVGHLPFHLRVTVSECNVDLCVRKSYFGLQMQRINETGSYLYFCFIKKYAGRTFGI